MGKTVIRIPRRVEPRPHVAFQGVKHGPDLMACYGFDGGLFVVFDSAREMDIHVAPGDDPVTAEDIEMGRYVPTDDGQPGFTYFIGGDEGAIKIGRSVNIDVRMRDIQACSPIPVRLLAMRRGGNYERVYHRLLAPFRLHGEWFTRCPAILAEIARLAGEAGRG